MDEDSDCKTHRLTRPKSGVLKTNNNDLGEKTNKKAKRVHFSDVIDICDETVTRLPASDDDDDRLEITTGMPLKGISMRQIRLHNPDDPHCNLEDFQVNYNRLNGGTIQQRRFNQRLQLRRSFRDFIGLQDFTAPLATMEEIDLFCDDSPDASCNVDGLGFVIRDDHLVAYEGSTLTDQNKRLCKDVELKVLDVDTDARFVSSEKSQLSRIGADGLVPQLQTEKSSSDETYDHHDEFQLHNTEHKNKSRTVKKPSVVAEFQYSSSSDITRLKNECTSVSGVNLSETFLNSSYDKDTKKGNVDTKLTVRPVNILNGMITDKRPLHIDTENSSELSEVVLLNMFSTVLPLNKNASPPLRSSDAGEASSDKERVMESATKNENCINDEELFSPLNSSRLYDQSANSFDKNALNNDFVFVDEVVIESEELHDHFIITDETLESGEFVLINRINVLRNNSKKMITLDSQSNESENVQQTKHTLEMANEEDGLKAETELILNEAVSPSEWCRQKYSIEMAPEATEIMLTSVPVLSNEILSNAIGSVTRSKHGIDKFDKAEFRLPKDEGNLLANRCSSCLLSSSKDGSTCYSPINSEDNKVPDNSLLTRCHSDALPSGKFPNSSNHAESRNRISDSNFTGEIKTFEKQFSCILVPDLIWLFRCDLVLWESDSANEPCVRDKSSRNWEGVTRCCSSGQNRQIKNSLDLQIIHGTRRLGRLANRK